ncbi:MAG: hypothetical protein ACREV7_19150 [Steroidobacteraceae bacterium]
MLKSLALGLLTVSAACTTVVFAHDTHNVKFHDQSVTWCHKGCDRQNQQTGNSDPSPAAAPEIDPAGAMGALTLLAGGLLVIRGRRRSRAA